MPFSPGWRGTGPSAGKISNLFKLDDANHAPKSERCLGKTRSGPNRPAATIPLERGEVLFLVTEKIHHWIVTVIIGSLDTSGQ